jgi:ABC-type antimicrobial peptide transport system permease subunit
MDVLLHDLRYAVRSLRRSVFFTGVTVVTLGLGVGVITALFAVVSAVLLRPIAVDQDRVVRIWKYDVERDLDRLPLSYPEFKAWREQTRSFEALAAINYANATSMAITVDGQPSSVALTPVSADFFAVLHGGKLLHGRWFQAADELTGTELVGPEALVPAIRETIRAQEPHVALESIETMDTLLARELSRPRTALTVTALFALMAVVLAAVGVYGVLSYEVTQRRHELAVRSALGASPARIFRAVVWRSVTLGGIGAAVGLVAASMVTRSLRSLLFEVAPADPSTFLAGAGVLVAIVLLASYLPARRAATADPLSVLRAE